MGLKKNREWLFFDLDDTIIPSSEIYKSAYEALGLRKDDVFMLARKNVKAKIQSGHTSSHNRILYFKEYLRLHSKFSASNLLAMTQRYESLLTMSIRKYLRKADRIDTLRKLAKSYNLAMVTNENCRTQMIKLQAIDTHGKFFSAVVTSEEVGYAKPHVNIFRRALEITGADPRDCVFIGDDIINDILPAIKLGMKAIVTKEFVDPIIPKRFMSKIIVIERLEELLELLKKRL